MNPQDFVLVIVGTVVCFAGYSMFRSMLPLWGFILGGWIAFILLPTVLPAQGSSLIAKGLAFLAGGVVGALLSMPLYYVIVFLSGAAFGGVLGLIFGSLIDLGRFNTIGDLNRLSEMSFPPIPHSPTQYLFMAIFAVIMGGLAIGFQQFMISASTAYIGAAAVISGVTVPIAQGLASPDGRGGVMLVGWLILGFIGLFVQYRMMGET